MVNSMTKDQTYAELYGKIKTLNKQWFYEKSEIDTTLLGYIQKSQTVGFVKNDGSIDANSYSLASHNHDGVYALFNHEHSQYLTDHQDITGKEDVSNKSTSITTDTGSTSKYPTVKAVEDYAQPKGDYLTQHQDISGKANSADLATVATSGSYTDLSNKPHIPTTVAELTDAQQYLTQHQSLSDIGGEVTVQKLSTANSGFTASYIVKQNGTQVGDAINIPKDYLVKSGEVKTATSADLTTLGSGYQAGDKYIDFVVNTVDNDGTAEHMYINVKDLVDTTVDWDNVTNKPTIAEDTHTHGNLLRNGTMTQTVTNGGNIVVTNSSNAVGVQSAVSVMEGIVDALIDYGTPEAQP